MTTRRIVPCLLLLVPCLAWPQERRVDPTFLRRTLSDLKYQSADLTTRSCRYKPVFGVGDPDARALRGISRYGEMIVDPSGASALVSYPAEEQIYVVLEGSGTLVYGEERVPVRKHDFVYLPPGIPHALEASTEACRVIVMGFRIPSGKKAVLSARPLLANIDDVKKETVSGHPPSTLYQLLMGDTSSKRDRLAAATVVTSLFIMEFDAGGTNIPHHHDTEEEIYLVLDGHGDMVAGGGMDGVEGRHPSRAGDAWFFRLNTTVGFYSGNKPGEPKARILAVRSLYPFSNR